MLPSETHVFMGRLHPERYGWGISGSVDGEVHGPAFQLAWRTTIQCGQLSVQLDGASPASVLDLKNVAASIASGVVDAIGFVNAAAIDVEIISCVTPRGELIVFNTAFDGLREGGSVTEEEQATFRQLATSPALHLALADVRQAIRSPSDTGFYCYRAVESVRQLYVPDGESDDGVARIRSWERLREATRVPKNDLTWLRDQAKGRRHGEDGGMSEQDRRQALLIARAVIQGYARQAAASDTDAPLV